MSIIKLPRSVYEKIKAGEVIEDPSSVVRELLDNSIDAGATSIEISIINGGMDTILIKDDGTGMPPEDLEISFLAHTTSKIKEFNDIFSLHTAGFRGEALSSICEIAFVNLASCTLSMAETHEIEVSEGQITAKTLSAPFVGTTIKVKDIFYNIPVRKGFMKTKGRESAKIKKEILLKALAHPEITFRFMNDGKLVLLCHKNEMLENRIKDLLKLEDPLYPIAYKENDFSIKGIVTGIDQVFDSAQNLYFYINNRPLISKSFYAVLWKSLSNLIPRSKYLGGCIYVYTHPKNIDPNVHPSKREVKIFLEDAILRKLYHLIRNTFYNKSYATFIDLPQEPHTEDDSINSFFSNSTEKNSLLPEFSSFSKTEFFPNLISKAFESSPFPFNSDEKIDKISLEESDSFLLKEIPYKYLGTAFETYWIVQKKEEIYFIDFHAAHERKRYEILREKTNTKTIESQLLLEPLIKHLSLDEMHVLETSLESFNNLGFDIAQIGENSLVIKAIPSFYKEKNTWLKDLEDYMKEFQNLDYSKADFKDYLLKREACRYSYMSQDFVVKNEIDYLLQDIFNQRFPLTCPHGRPFIFNLPKKQLESQFLRK